MFAENLKKLKNHIYFFKKINLSIVYSVSVVESIDISKILGLIDNIEENQKIYNHV